jgi:phosphoribosylformimino-5-aminoimidazole carboxamide ribotide isomerase
MDLYPAIDIRGGGAVRLTQGDFARQSEYGDPVALARRFASGGAPWLHVVDLDAARTGRAVNRALVLEIARAVDVPVETGGGVRTADDVEELLDGGVSRVILGTAAVEDPGATRTLAANYPDRVAIGLDYRLDAAGRTEVASRGWVQGSGRTVSAVLAEFDGVGLAAVIVTAIERDGMLTGPDLEGLAAVLSETSIPVIASGGVGSAADIRALVRLSVPRPSSDTGRSTSTGAAAAASAGDGYPDTRRLTGAITGKALVDGRLTVEEGVAACAPSA